jgi:hypothetical protein
MATKSTKNPAPSRGEKAGGDAWYGTILKWIGAITAAISLALGFIQLLQFFADTRERAVRIREAVADARTDERDGSYKIAWLTLADATRIADEGGSWARLFGQLDGPRRELNRAREEVAMDGLRHAHVSEKESWHEFAEQFLPLLVHGAPTSSGVRKADLLAHIGWAYFLAEKESSRDLDPVPQYQQALALDPQNPYAHAFWGHWILWEHGPLAEAQKHFAAAVASGRERAFVREIQFAAYGNVRSAGSDAALLSAAAEMRKNQEKFSPSAAEKIWDIYAIAFRDHDEAEKANAVVPPVEQIALIQSLFCRPDFSVDKIPIRESALASLEEAAGQRRAALLRWRALRATSRPGSSGEIQERADAAIARLSAP